MVAVVGVHSSKRVTITAKVQCYDDVVVVVVVLVVFGGGGGCC